MKPRALDLFCCAGGATRGLQRAGFHVTGVDIRPQPRYCGDEFHQADALTFPLDGFDFIWASPPCQDYSYLKGLSGSSRGMLIGKTRQRLRNFSAPYCIENVGGAKKHLICPVMLCGSMFGLEVWRHRYFEFNPGLLYDIEIFPPQCNHGAVPNPIDVTGSGGPTRKARLSGGGRSRKPVNLNHAREVMGIDWMSRQELSQAIPPAYAEFIGRAAIEHINARRLAA
jgi:DNA (cytosine-5)-methyltransferase 1